MNRKERRRAQKDPDYKYAQKIAIALFGNPPKEGVPACVVCHPDEEDLDKVFLFYCPSHYVTSGVLYMGWSEQEAVDRLNAALDAGVHFAVPVKPIPEA